MQTKHRFTSLIAAGALAASLAACGGSPAKQSTGERLDDGVLTAKVKTALLKDGEVKGTSVNVDTFKGTVQLSGFVRTDAERVRAGELARGVAGVEEVRNDLQVRGD
jgi:osmotically-inducible protein OsmY